MLHSKIDYKLNLCYQPITVLSPNPGIMTVRTIVNTLHQARKPLMQRLISVFLLLSVLLPGCLSSSATPPKPEDLLSGRYRILPREGKPLDAETLRLVLTVSRSQSGWILGGLGDDEPLDRIEERNGNICARSDFVVVCALKPGTVLNGEALARSEWILAVRDRGVWNLQRIE